MADDPIVQFYDRIAPVYDWLAAAPVVRGWRRRAADSLALSPGDTVVEMGCGTGANLPYLRERVGPTGRVIGLDRTPGMLEVARKRVARKGWTNVSLVRGDATRPPVDGVDAVLGSFVVGLLPDPAAAVDGWIDALAPGGRVAVLEAGRSERAVGAAVNPLFRTFVRLSSPGEGNGGGSPAAALDRRIAAAAETISTRTVDRTHDTAALGLVRVISGRRPEN
jgi:ubiquinone/menaquinone biosynthesis C-methylase UbiE